MANRRSLLRGLAALPALAVVPAVVASTMDDPFVGYHQEIVDLQEAIETLPEDSAEQDAAWLRWKEIDDLALAGHPTTLAGALGAVEYARRELHQFSVEGLEAPNATDVLVLHLLDSALGVLRRQVE